MCKLLVTASLSNGEAMPGSRSRENAATFIIAEFLKVNYLEVIVYAVIPIFLYF